MARLDTAPEAYGVRRALRFSPSSEPLRVYTHPGGSWLGVKVDHSFRDDRWEVYLGKGRETAGSWQSLGVPFASYEEACALALSMFAQLVDPFMVAENLLQAGNRAREEARRLNRQREALGLEPLGPIGD